MTITLADPPAAIKTGGRLHENRDTARLVELALERGEGRLSEHGALVVETGKHTGRLAQDKFIVRDALTQNDVWWSPSTKPMASEAFANLHEDFLKYLSTLDDVFVQDEDVVGDVNIEIWPRICVPG